MNLQFLKMSVSGDLLRNFGAMLLRIVLALVLTGAYLHYLFEIDSILINIVWLLVMTACVTVCAIRSLQTRSMAFVFPLFLGMLAGLIVAGVLFMLCAGLFDNALHARFLVPVAALMLSSMLTTCAAGTNAYGQSLKEDSRQYDFLVGNGASHIEAVAPFVRKALESSVGQMAEGTGVIQLVAMPAMFGMILGGCPPVTAMKFQLFILIASVLSSLIALVLAIYLADTRLFDNFGRLRKAKRTESSK